MWIFLVVPPSHSLGAEVLINGHRIVDADLETILGQGKTTHIDEGSELIHLFPIDFHRWTPWH